MDKNSILKAVIDYKNNKTVRFHMPGHKGRPVGLPFDDALAYDLTEIDCTGNLLDPCDGDVTSDTLDRLTSVYGTSATVMSAGGATLGLQAAILACVRRSPCAEPSILCHRTLHRSAVHALALCGVEPTWLCDPYEVDKISGEFCAMIVTSPDYYGNMLDISRIADSCTRLGIPLIVDCAHGSHLAFYDGGRLHPTKQGASLVVDSPHKTLPALTGCALLHGMGDFTRAELLGAMRVFSSTSPSYLLQCSLDRCTALMEKNGNELLAELLVRVNLAKHRIGLLGFTVPDAGDPFRLCIRDANSPKLEALLNASGVVCEFADAENVVLIPSVSNTITDFERLIEALKAAKTARFKPSSSSGTAVLPGLPEKAMGLREAVLSVSEEIDVENAENRICAEPVTPYPPGVPVLMPGETVNKSMIPFIIGRGIDRIRVIKRKI